MVRLGSEIGTIAGEEENRRGGRKASGAWPCLIHIVSTIEVWKVFTFRFFRTSPMGSSFFTQGFVGVFLFFDMSLKSSEDRGVMTCLAIAFDDSWYPNFTIQQG